MNALLDSGSESNFITEDLCDTLKLLKHSTNITINGIGQVTSRIIHRASVQMESRLNAFKINIPCLVIKRITNNIPHVSFDASKLNIPKNCFLADPNFNE